MATLISPFFDQTIRNTVDDWMSEPDLFESISISPEEYVPASTILEALAEIALRCTKHLRLPSREFATQMLPDARIRLPTESVPDSLLAFQHMFPDDDACAAWLIEMRWPDGFVCPACGHEKGWALRRKAHTFECAGCRRQTSVTAGTILHASKLPLTVWFWAAYGDPLQRHLCPAAPETARYRLLPQRLAARPQAARQHGRPRAQPVVAWWKSSIPDQRRSSHRRARTQPRSSSAPSNSQTSQAACGWPKFGNRRRSRRHRENRRLVRLAAPQCPWAAAHLPAVDRLLQPQRMGARRLPRAASRIQAYLDEFVFRFNRRKTRHAAFRSLFRLATNAEPLTYSACPGIAISRTWRPTVR